MSEGTDAARRPTPYLLAPLPLELLDAEPEFPPAGEPDELDCPVVLWPAAAPVPDFVLQSAGRVACFDSSQRSSFFAFWLFFAFWPERVSAGVLVAFSCAAPEALMWPVALSRPVDFDDVVPVVVVSVLIEDVPAAPPLIDEPVVPLPYAEDDVSLLAEPLRLDEVVFELVMPLVVDGELGVVLPLP